ncbi:MAG TPA: YggS family pyridoxal phosphate-dependent enzyme [Nitrospira sp.]|nr:YggS family pyridoxal phosphate-dependent enzyme [Nitrospira sp.]
MACGATGSVHDRLTAVLDGIRLAALAAGRRPDSVRLVAATKGVPTDRILEAVEAGLQLAGENKLQEAVPKMRALQGRPIRWHFIGHLQRRKARDVVGHFDLIHSVDSLDLAAEINRRAATAGVRQEVLLGINIGNEPSKSGFSPGQVKRELPAIGELPHLEVKGLMAIPPPVSEAEQARPYFRRMRELRDELSGLRLPTMSLAELSMGMSADYRIAIEEGATIVRIGTAIFGARPT